MTEKSKHYLQDGKVFVGPVHKVGGKIMTGLKHTAASMVVTHIPPKQKTTKGKP